MKTPIETLLDEIDYTPLDVTPTKDNTPYATHEGILNIGNVSITVYVLNTGQRVIDKESINKVFGNLL